MRPQPAKRLDTSGVQAPLNDLDGAFADVTLPDLPPGTPPPTNLPEKPRAAADAAVPVPPLWKPGRVVLRRERAQRGGKTVIVIDHFATHLPAAFIADVARRLRAACGCGGAVKGRTVEIQGDQPGKVRTALEAEGFEVAGVR